jgi:hypothetical protein
MNVVQLLCIVCPFSGSSAVLPGNISLLSCSPIVEEAGIKQRYQDGLFLQVVPCDSIK